VIIVQHLIKIMYTIYFSTNHICPAMISYLLGISKNGISSNCEGACLQGEYDRSNTVFQISTEIVSLLLAMKLWFFRDGLYSVSGSSA